MTSLTLPETPSDLILKEATRLTQRYIDEVVLAYGLCPWAEPSILRGQVAIVPLQGSFNGPHGAREAARELYRVLKGVESQVELVLVPFPEVSMGRNAFDEVAREVRQLDHDRSFALAAFHPDPVGQVSDAARAVTLLRRSPDPMIQAVRTSVLERIQPDRGEGTTFLGADSILQVLAKSEQVSTRQRVIDQNFRMLNQVGRATLEEKMASIQSDRAASYTRIRRQFGEE